MLFTEGAVIMSFSLLHRYDYPSYQPIGISIELINKWNGQGAEIVHCTSRKEKQVSIIADILIKNGFCGTKRYYCDKNQTYRGIVELEKPNVLFEDDCKSIGFAAEQPTKTPRKVLIKIVWCTNW